MAIGEPSGVVVSINGLDVGNPLHLQNSDNSNSVIILFKLLESYASNDLLSAQWDKCNVMVLTWIINVLSQDVYMGLVSSENVATVWKELNETYDKVDGFYNLLQNINFVKQGGSFVADCLDDCYQPVRSFLLTRDHLPEVKDAYNVVSRVESHRGVLEFSSVTESKQNATSFVAKTFNNNKR
ncbi:hypothetical protein Tco_1321039 [Tanacetum coccineum]